jgi:hypothetical protein
MWPPAAANAEVGECKSSTEDLLATLENLTEEQDSMCHRSAQSNSYFKDAIQSLTFENGRNLDCTRLGEISDVLVENKFQRRTSLLL